MSAAKLPPAVPKILIWITPFAIAISASTNVASLYHLGTAIGLGVLAFTIPATVVIYELASSALFFFTPKRFAALRKSAAVGAALGFLMTVGLAALWLAIEDKKIAADFMLRLVLKPIPSLVAAAFAHMFVLVLQYRNASDETAEELPATTVEATAVVEEIGAAVEVQQSAADTTAEDAAAQEVAMQNLRNIFTATGASDLADFYAAPAALKPPVLVPPQRPVPAAPQKPLAVPQQPPATPGDSLLHRPSRRPQQPVTAAAPQQLPAAPVVVELPRVREEHVLVLLAEMEEIRNKGGNPMDLKSGQAMKHLPALRDRQVSNVLKVARHHWQQMERASA